MSKFRGLFTVCFAPALVGAANPAPALEWVKQIQVGDPGATQVAGVASDGQGSLYIAGSTYSSAFPATHVYGPASLMSAFVVKLDPSGNVAYAIRVGGSGSASAAGIAVASDGGVYVAGTTSSMDFPVTTGAYQTAPYPKALVPTISQPGNFVFRLNPTGTLAWATYFGDSNSLIGAVAAAADGSVYVSGVTRGNLPVTTGAYQTQFEPAFVTSPGCIGPCFQPTSGFLTKLNASGSALFYSTYLSVLFGDPYQTVYPIALAVDSLGNAYFANNNIVGLMNATGSALIQSMQLKGIVGALALDRNGHVFASGSGGAGFRPTPGAFQTSPQPPDLPLPGYFGPDWNTAEAFVARIDGGLTHVLNATLLGGEVDDMGQSLAIDSSGNVIVGGFSISKGFPTLAPFQGSFSSESGFVAELDSSLSNLIFSTYAGDARPFSVYGAFPVQGGDIVLAGSTWVAMPGNSPPWPTSGGTIIANRIALAPAPTVRLDSVVNLASKIAIPLSPGEAIEARGAGFGADAQVLIDGAAAEMASRSATSVVALLPASLKTSGAVKVEVTSGGVISNSVFMPAAVASPGIYSIHGEGYGQGYIRNGDGSFNSPNRPAKIGEAITIFATGVGPITIQDGQPVTAMPASIFVDGFYANAVAAQVAPAGALPGSPLQITVTVPDPPVVYPNLVGFTFPSAVAVTLALGVVASPFTYALAPDTVESQPGIALYLK